MPNAILILKKRRREHKHRRDEMRLWRAVCVYRGSNRSGKRKPGKAPELSEGSMQPLGRPGDPGTNHRSSENQKALATEADAREASAGARGESVSLSLELSDVMLPELENVKADYRQDTLPICAGLYEAFLVSGANGRDGLLCYLHLLWTYRRQGTNKPWAVGKYLSQGLNLSPKRVRIAKGLLHKMGLVEYERDRTASGKLGKVYTRLNLVANPGTTGAVGAPLEKSPENTTGAVSPLVVPVQQMLEERKEIKNAQNTAQEEPTAPPSQLLKKGPKTPHGRLTRLFCELYKKKTGAARAPFNPACAAQLRNDIARIGEDKLARCLRSIFTDPPRGMRAFDYMSIHHFLPDIEKRLADEDRRLWLLKTCKACGKPSETTGIDCPKCGEPDAFQVREARHA